jgi:hypothetical protein
MTVGGARESYNKELIGGGKEHRVGNEELSMMEYY